MDSRIALLMASLVKSVSPVAQTRKFALHRLRFTLVLSRIVCFAYLPVEVLHAL